MSFTPGQVLTAAQLNVAFSAQQAQTITLQPTGEPAAPATGAVLYCDQANGNKLTIKTASGAKLVVGP